MDMLRANEVFAGQYCTRPDLRHPYGGDRFISVGWLDARLVVLAWTPRGVARRIISMRHCMSAKRRNSAHTSPELDEVQELDEEWVKGADLYNGKKLVRRGRPKLEKPRQLLSLRLPSEVIARWKASGPGWQRLRFA